MLESDERPGRPDPADVGRADPEEQLQHALRLAYRELNRRDRTVAEMQRHLTRHGVANERVEQAVAVLTDQGYLDDARFARQFAHDKGELDQWGADRIRRALVQRGVEHELVEAALERQTPDDELERAVGLLRRRFPTPSQTRRDRDRALGVLLRKGYDSELAIEALRVHAGSADA